MKRIANNKRIEVFKLFLPEIKELLANRDAAGLKKLLKDMYSIDIAEGLRYLDGTEKIVIFKLLGLRKSVEVFEDLKFEDQTYILNNLNSEEVTQVINEMAHDERADLFKVLPERLMKKFLSVMSKEEAEDVRKLVSYKEGTAGSLMTTEFAELKGNMTARQAVIFLQDNLRTGQKSVYTAYITDDAHKLVGGIGIQDLLKAPPDIAVKDIMIDANTIKVNANLDTKEVAHVFKKYDLTDAPVVNEENTFMGIITIDDIVDIIEKEATRDIYEIGKMDARGGEIITYASATAMDLVRRRAGWLILLLIFDFLTGTVLKHFEHSLSAVVALAFFIPMLLDTGGNAGAQTSITIIRGLATGDVNIKKVWKVVRLELIAAIFIGLVVGVVAFGRAVLMQKDFILAAVVGSTMLSIALLAIATGIVLPLFSKKVGLDPAVLAGPITTSIVDVVGLIIYFKIAQFFIPALRF